MRWPELCLLTALALAGCATAPPSQVVVTERWQPPGSSPAAGHLAAASKLASLPPDAQLAMVEHAGTRCREGRMPRACLRWAVLLAEPGHASADLAVAHQQLERLYRIPPRLSPDETMLVELLMRGTAERLRLGQALAEVEARIARLTERPTSRELDAARTEAEVLKEALAAAEEKLAALRAIEAESAPES